MRFVFSVFLLALAIPLCAFDFSLWKAEHLSSAKFENNVLHLTKSNKAKNNASLYRKYTKQNLQQFIGKRVTLSAEVELLAASHPDSVGVSLVCKLKNGKSLTSRTLLPFCGKRPKTKVFTSIVVPRDTVMLTAKIDAPRAWNRTADTLWSNIELKTSDPSEPQWNCGTGNFLAVGKNPLFWKWQAADGLKADFKKGVFSVAGKGKLSLRCQDAYYELSGKTPEAANLVIDVTEATPFAIEITSYGKKNATVKVPPVKENKKGRRVVRIPLSTFAPFHDLVRLEEISFIIDGKQTFKNCTIANLDLDSDTKNLIFDPSFEISNTPGGAYNMWGDYRTEKATAGLSFDTSEKFHGKRSLKIASNGFIYLFASDEKGKGAVFSLYAKGKDNFQVFLQKQYSDMHGAVGMPFVKQEFKAAKKWKRYELVIPESRKKDRFQRRYIILIKNTGKSDLYIDAVQMEQNVLKATAFKAERDTNFRFRVNVNLPMGPRPEPKDIPSNKRSGGVKFTVVNLSGKNYSSIPVRGAIPFAPGELFDPSCVKVVDSDGKTVPAQFNVLARRTLDKSIVSLGVDFNTVLKAGKNSNYTLNWGKEKFSAAGKNIAVAKGKDIHIDTGKLKLVLTPDENSFLKGADAFCGVTTADGKLFRSKANIVRIEDNGPQRATVFLRGTALLAWELRLTFYKDQPFAAIDYSFENNFSAKDPLYRNVRSIFIQLPWSKEFKLGNVSGSQDALFVQRHARSGTFEWDVYQRLGNNRSIIKDLKLSGTVSGKNHAVNILEFAELAPRAIGFKDGNIQLYHYPPEGTLTFDVLSGLSGTMQFNYSPVTKNVPEYAPAIIYADPEYVSKSRVFGEFISDKDLHKHFPRSGKVVAGIFNVLENSAELSAFYGLGDYGDAGSRNYYSNHETAVVRNMWLNYLASGSAAAFRYAAAHSLHQRDIDQVHFRYGTTGVHTHNPYRNNNFNFHTGHFWLTGVVYHYLITGDRRSFESAISAMAVLVQKSVLRYKGGRERHRMLYHLAELYELTGIELLKTAFERQYNFGAPSNSGAYYGALAYEALEKLYAATGEQKYLDRLTNEVKEFYKSNRIDVADMPADRTARPTYQGSAEEGRSVMTLYAGALAARRFNDPKYIPFLNPGKNNDPVMTRILDPLSRDASVNWLRNTFAVMRDAGIKENPSMPDSYSFIAGLTGNQTVFNNYEPFVFEIVPDADKKASIDLFRYRKFRYWKSKKDNDFVICKLYDSNGKLLKSLKLDANLPHEYKRVAVSSPDGKNIRAEVVFQNDCWGGVSSSNKMRLSSNRRFGARSRISVPFAFYIKVPMSGKLKINWKWDNNENRNAGVILAAMLKDKSGKTIAHTAYTIPDMHGETYSAILDIPREYRGKTVKLYMNDFKWVSWKLENLDYPWLGNTPEDLCSK